MRVRPLPCQSKWLKAQVSGQVAIRSYMVCTEDGRLYHQNRLHLYKVPENFQGMPDEDKVQSKVDTQIRPPARRPSEGIPERNLQHCRCQLPGSQVLSPLHQVFPYLSLLEVAELLGGLRT